MDTYAENEEGAKDFRRERDGEHSTVRVVLVLSQPIALSFGTRAHISRKGVLTI